MYSYIYRFFGGTALLAGSLFHDLRGIDITRYFDFKPQHTVFWSFFSLFFFIFWLRKHEHKELELELRCTTAEFMIRRRRSVRFGVQQTPQRSQRNRTIWSLETRTRLGMPGMTYFMGSEVGYTVSGKRCM